MRKRYISEEIGDEYRHWKRGSTIFITAPTGAGKTWFIVSEYLQYMRTEGKRILILCNRNLLRRQYWFSIIPEFESYEELENTVKVETYQYYAALYRKGCDLKKNLNRYDAVVFDEYQFFIEDAKFNSTGTFLLFQDLIESTLNSIKIFITATPESIREIVLESIKKCILRNKWKSAVPESYDRLLKYSYGTEEIDTSHFECWEVPDKETLFQIISESTKKTVIFIDSKDKAERWKNHLVQDYKIPDKDIVLLNSDNLDKNSEFVMKLSCTNILNAKILITTCVLDNGVSIQDADVENLVILSDNPTSFKQMAGRVRTESSKHINLFFLVRDYKDFGKRKELLKGDLDRIDRIKNDNKFTMCPLETIYSVWDGDSDSDFYKKYFVVADAERKIYSHPGSGVQIIRGSVKILLNQFAYMKLKQSYLWETRLYSAALKSPTEAIQVQLGWIGIERERLKILSSSYVEEKKEEIVEQLLTIQNYSSKQLKTIKEKIVKDFKGIMECDTRNGSINNDKLEELCSKYNLVFEKQQGAGRKMYYYVREKEIRRKGQ